jgi:hypothetical protein
MREQRNALSLPARLPIELLGHVFEIAQRLWPPQPRFGWIALSHVSRYWRSIALSRLALWSFISSDFPRDVWETFLRRAGTAPVVFADHSLDTETPTLPLDVILQHFHHTTSVTLRGLAPTFFSAMDLLPAPASPLLEELALEASSACATLTYTLPITFVERHSSRLKRINLSGYSFPWTALPPYALQLTSLRIDFNTSRAPTPGNISVQLTLEDVAQGLARMSNLEDLTLLACLPFERGSRDIRDSVHLPRLKKLHIEEICYSCMDVFFALRLPPTTAILITSRETRPDQFQALVHLTRTHLSCPGHIITRALIVTGPTFDFNQISVQTPAYDLGYCRAGHTSYHPEREALENTTFSLTVRFVDGFDIPISLFTRELCSAIPFRDLHHISLGISPVWYPSEWRATVSQAMGLTCLCLSAGAEVSFCIALLLDAQPEFGPPTTEQRSVQNQSSVLFPALETLSIHRDAHAEPPDDQMFLHPILDLLLSLRKARGMPLRRLEVSGYPIVHNALQKLRRVVPDVVWQGEGI